MTSPEISLVTGGAGFIGGYIVKHLLSRGTSIRILDISPPPPTLHEDITYFHGSITDTELLYKAMKGVTHVYHLAGSPHLWASDPSAFHRINYQGTLKVLDAARKASVQKFVHTSTESILRGYNDNDQTLIDESSPFPTLEEMPGPYTRSKLLADLAVREAALEGMPVIIVYPTGPIGPDDPHLTAPNKMIGDFMKGNTPAYLECKLNFAHVDDIAVAHILAAQKGTPGDRYILGNENLYLSEILQIIRDIFHTKVPNRKIPYWLAELTGRVAEQIANFTHKMPIASLEGVRLTKANLVFDCSKAVQELGMPQTPVRRAIQEAGEWLIKQSYVKLD